MDWLLIGLVILGVFFAVDGFLLLFSRSYYRKVKETFWKENGETAPAKPRATEIILATNLLITGIFCILFGGFLLLA